VIKSYKDQANFKHFADFKLQSGYYHFCTIKFQSLRSLRIKALFFQKYAPNGLHGVGGSLHMLQTPGARTRTYQ